MTRDNFEKAKELERRWTHVNDIITFLKKALDPDYNIIIRDKNRSETESLDKIDIDLMITAFVEEVVRLNKEFDRL